MSKHSEHNIDTAYYLEKAQEIGNIGTWDLDLINNVLYWTKQVYVICGIPEGVELTYELFLEVVHPEDKELVNESWMAALGGAPYDLEHRMLVNGVVKWVREKGEIEFDQNGTPIRAIGVCQDITSQKEIEHKLQTQQYYLEKAQEIGKIGTWDEYPNIQKLSWTKEVYNIYEIPETTEITDDFITRHVHPDDKEFVIDRWKEALNGQLYDIEFRIVVNDKIKWIKEKAEYFYDEKGKVSRVLGVSQDITDLMEITIALKEARIKAEESSRLKSAFLANVSHEIRTPLNGILGFAELIDNNESISQEELKRYLNIIKQSGQNLLNVINDIIDISKIESNQLDLHYQPFDLHNFLENILHLIEQNIPPDLRDDVKIIFTKESSAQTFLIESDQSRLQQILLNLLSNSLKFTDNGSIEFGYQIDQASDKIVFFVKDTGKGIPEKDLSRIFERFEQVNPKDERGTGLGLAICKSLVALLGGTINVNSEVNKGTVFHFEIPLKAIDLIDEANPYKNNKRDLLGSKILIVDDNRINCLFLFETLKKDGLLPTKVYSGEDAVEQCRENDFDVVLMDIGMSGIDGYEAMRQIQEFKPDMNFIIQTGYAMTEEKKKAFSNGASGYISKPINIEQLKRMILECL
ncbi:MAG: PAS domain-containing protein [Crocinitomicaceae bacterium]|nr:PAS domain-containing protein [Crocinitomicaceae bacterium]